MENSMAIDNQENKTGPVSLADEEAVKQILVNAVFGLWDIVNNLTRLKPSKSERYRVTIFGSARAEPGTFVYEEVKRVATALAEMDCDIIRAAARVSCRPPTKERLRPRLQSAIAPSGFAWTCRSSRRLILL
jgi:hypothetical protein